MKAASIQAPLQEGRPIPRPAQLQLLQVRVPAARKVLDPRRSPFHRHAAEGEGGQPFSLSGGLPVRRGTSRDSLSQNQLGPGQPQRFDPIEATTIDTVGNQKIGLAAGEADPAAAGNIGVYRSW